MISVEHVRLMAAYNRWQNQSLYREADTLDEPARKLDRGAFFGSIHGTLSHLVLGDRMWLHRFTDGSVARPAITSVRDTATALPDWAELKRERGAVDDMIEAWAGALEPGWLESDLTWHSGVLGRHVTRPRWMLVAHFFNHQTHHRGQAHALLTAAGTRPDDTDIPFMPGL